jgi:hypothetical protein
VSPALVNSRPIDAVLQRYHIEHRLKETSHSFQCGLQSYEIEIFGMDAIYYKFFEDKNNKKCYLSSVPKIRQAGTRIKYLKRNL